MLQVWLEKEKKCTSQIPDAPFSSSYLCSGYLCDCQAFLVNDPPPHSFVLLDPSSEPSQCFSDHTGGHPCIPYPPEVYFTIVIPPVVLHFFFFFGLFRAPPRGMWRFLARGRTGTAATILHQMYSNAGFEPCLVTYTTAHSSTGSLTQ